jgi:hypothetical protein
VNLYQVVIGKVKRDSRFVIFELLAEGIRQAR